MVLNSSEFYSSVMSFFILSSTPNSDKLASCFFGNDFWLFILEIYYFADRLELIFYSFKEFRFSVLKHESDMSCDVMLKFGVSKELLNSSISFLFLFWFYS